MTDLDTVNTYFEALKRRDFKTVSGQLSDDLEFVTTLESMDKETFLELIEGLLHAFPDWRCDHGEIRIRNRIATTTLLMSGTHSEPLSLPLRGLKPVPPTGKKVVLPQQDFHHTLSSGKIVRIESDADPHSGIIGTLEQIGVRLPPIWVMKLLTRVPKLWRR
jgi:ketosteroid isomerase-like protein